MVTSIRRFKVDGFAAYWTGYDLNRAAFGLMPVTDGDFVHAATSNGKQRCIPGTQALTGKRLIEVLGGSGIIFTTLSTA
ncbi:MULTISPECIES: hypothetical protein [Spongiibacter]|uniref:hypothetical protein n=1 Tax=Spongiibacter TaxID=630749 RepID=UPI001E28B49E|nr:MULTISPECIES: hypothetical protein [Spongiibacter]MBM7424824.1 hypothetical protein [Spongiibacter marinus]